MAELVSRWSSHSKSSNIYFIVYLDSTCTLGQIIKQYILYVNIFIQFVIKKVELNEC